uniref:C3H1-type domain-containing protein n=1 Tax=Rhinopithecus roxellana TaxID=61622 RepID=A0A2K6QBF0_RHIRO
IAEYLASIFHKVNCSFYFRIGACCHGDRCSWLHNKPTFSQTLALLNIYHNPQNSSQSAADLCLKMEKYGEVVEINVYGNLGDHLMGNFCSDEDVEKAMIDLNNHWFNGQPIHVELSPVTDFREACCRQYEMGECTRGGFCNCMHLKPISRELRWELYGRHCKKRRSRSRSLEHSSRSRDRSRSGGGGGGGGQRDRRPSRDHERSGRF